MKISSTYIIGDISFDFGRFNLVFDECSILRKSVHRLYDSLVCSHSSYDDYVKVVEFISTTLKEFDCPFHFSLHSISADTAVYDDVEYIFLKVFVRVS